MTDAVRDLPDTRSRIVEVAARLLQEQGAAAVTTRGVAEAAGVQAPAIYRLFGDKEGLLDAVAEHVMSVYVAEKVATVEAAAADEVDPVVEMRHGWDAQIAFGLANPTLFALLNDPARGGASPAALLGREVLATRIHRIATDGRLRVSEQRAIDLVHAAGVGVVQSLLGTPPEQRDLGVADAMYDAVMSQMITDAPVEHGDASATVAFRAMAPTLPALSAGERAVLVEWLDRVIDAG